MTLGVCCLCGSWFLVWLVGLVPALPACARPVVAAVPVDCLLPCCLAVDWLGGCGCEFVLVFSLFPSVVFCSPSVIDARGVLLFCLGLFVLCVCSLVFVWLVRVGASWGCLRVPSCSVSVAWCGFPSLAAGLPWLVACLFLFACLVCLVVDAVELVGWGGLLVLACVCRAC